jgi:hypothetical protein
MRLDARAAVSGILLSSLAWAQQPQTGPGLAPAPVPDAAPSPAPSTASDRSVHFAVTPRARLGFNADFRDAPGDVTVTRLGVEFKSIIPVGDRGRLDLGIDEEFSRYELSNATGFIAGNPDPFGEFNRLFLTGRYAQQQTEQWSWFAGGLVGLAAENGAELSRSVEGGGYAGVRYAISRRLQIGGGVGVFTRLEDDPLLIPILSLEWRLADGWTLSSGARPGLTLSYEPVESVTISLSGAYQYRDFRLDRDGPQPGGVLRDTGWDVLLEAAYTPTRQIEVSAGLGWTFGRTFKLLDSGGREMADIDADAAPFVALGLSYRF